MKVLRRFIYMLTSVVKSIVRTPARSVIVPLVSFTIVVLLTVFCNVLDGYDKKIQRTYDDAVISGNFTSLNGKKNSDLLLKLKEIEKLSMDMFSDVNYSYSFKYEPYLLVRFGGAGSGEIYDDFETINYNSINPYEIERNEAKIFLLPDAVFTTSLENSPNLLASAPEYIKYAEGIEDSSFVNLPNICAVSSEFAKRYGLSLGDEMSVILSDEEMMADDKSKSPLPFKSSGMPPMPPRYVQTYTDYTISAIFVGYTDNILISMPSIAETSYCYVDHRDIPEGASLLEEKLIRMKSYRFLGSFSFVFNDSRDVAKFRTELAEMGFSYPSHIGTLRKTIVIDDSALQNKQTGFIKMRSYFEVLYPFIFIIIVAIAFVMTYLLVRTRQNELAIMRSMGSGTVRAWFIFFIEQILLAFVGSILGIILAYIVFGGLSKLMLVSILLYAGCYVISAAVAVGAVNSMNVFQVLTVKE